jgi:hypothetical protein
MSTLLLDRPDKMLGMSHDELSYHAARTPLNSLREYERESTPFGPFHRAYILERAPYKIHKLLRLGALHPTLVAGNNDFVSPTGQFPSANLRAAINTSTTETNLWDPGRGWFMVPADSLRGGQRWQINFGGIMGTTSTPTIVFTTRWGTNNSTPPTGTSLGAGPTVTLGTFTAQPWMGMGYYGCRKIDVAASLATVTGNGVVWIPAAAAATVTPHAVFGGTIATTIDQTINQGIGVSVTWGTSNASNTITPQWADPWTSG